jgi:hypothetical protein
MRRTSPLCNKFLEIRWFGGLQGVEPGPSSIDGVSEMYGLHDWNINNATDAARFQKLFGQFEKGTNAIDHTGKDV